MSDPLFLADLTDVAVGRTVTVAGDEGRHAASVRRIRVGEVVVLADGRGQAIRGPVVEVARSAIQVQVDEVMVAAPPRLRWVVVQALPKGSRAEAAVEGLTELGVHEIVAWQAERSVVRWDQKVDKGVARWQATAREAGKQSRRWITPHVSYGGTEQVCQRIAASDLAIICHEEAVAPLSGSVVPAQGEVVVVIGPEGGITARELEQFGQAGAVVVSLGETVLRTSTAGLVALAQLQLLAQLA